MGHLHHHKAYQDLQARLDQLPQTFPDTPEGRAILRLLFTPEEAELTARLPLRPSSARAIAARLGRPEAEVQLALERLADRGLVLDLWDERRQRSSFCVAPPVVGFVEFSLMRRRSDLDQPALARAYEAYLESEGGLTRALFGGETTLGRTLVHEQALAEDDLAELLTHERARELVADAGAWAVSLCYCRHKAEHLGRACAAPMEVCLTLGSAASFVTRHGHGRALEQAAALELLERSREEGLVFIADNVQRKLTYLCSCCGCCCAQLQAINRFGLPGAVKTSPALAQIDRARCVGCGRCVRRCPIQAISLHARPLAERVRDPRASKRPLAAVVDERVCLGCGVCAPACREGALTLALRGERVLTPEGTIERVLTMALERDRLQHLLFDDQGGPSLALLNRLAGAVLRLPPVKRALMRDQLRSRFIGFLAGQGRRAMRE